MNTIGYTLVVEDNANARDWLENCVRAAFPGTVVATAQNFREARYAIVSSKDQPFDLALIDIGLPDGNGIELLSLAKHVARQCSCVVTTVYDDDDHLFHAIEAGADGYLLKYHETEKLIELLRRILDGEPPLSPTMARRVLEIMQMRTKPCVEGEVVALTPRETEVLALLGKGFQLAQVAARLEVSHNTASSHVKSIYRKLKISNRAEAALAAAGRGLLKEE